MLRHFLNSKIHRATVTDANLNYVGSITIDEEFLEKANILEWEKVEILNINNGERFQTYAIKGARGSKCFCLMVRLHVKHSRVIRLSLLHMQN